MWVFGQSGARKARASPNHVGIRTEQREKSQGKSESDRYSDRAGREKPRQVRIAQVFGQSGVRKAKASLNQKVIRHI
jgi:hypothetical protein